LLRGCTEALYRDQRGRWRSVVVSTVEADAPTERLRLSLSCAAALQHGFDPIGPGWWIHPGKDQRMLVDIHVNLVSAAMEQDLLECLGMSDSGVINVIK
jgi:hypothetical protein